MCDGLKLPFEAQGYGAAAQKAAKDEMAYSDFLEGLMRGGMAGRTVCKQNMMTRLAGLPAIKTLEQFNYDFAKGVKRSQIDELAGLDFIATYRTEGGAEWSLSGMRGFENSVSGPSPMLGGIETATMRQTSIGIARLEDLTRTARRTAAPVLSPAMRNQSGRWWRCVHRRCRSCSPPAAVRACRSWGDSRGRRCSSCERRSPRCCPSRARA
jgi:hypothetical protein